MKRKSTTGKKKTKKKPAAGGTSRQTTAGHEPEIIDFAAARASLESFMGQMGRSIEGRDLSPVDQAQEIMYKAWEATSRKRAVELAAEALDVSGDCADAYNLLAVEASRSVEESIGFYLMGVMAGERALGPHMFEENAGHFWGLLETRPYMRARAGLAFCLWDAGQRAEAVGHWLEMLRLNPGDNQGIRDVLISALIELDRDAEAERLYAQYKDEIMATWSYSRVLLDFRKSGDSPVAARSLAAAIEENPHVPAYLLGRKKMPATQPDYIGFGDENEAVAYADRARPAWVKTEGALEWLAKTATP